MRSKPSFFDLLFLCLRSKCPVCQTGQLFRPYSEIQSVGEIFVPLSHCPECNFEFKRETGYYSGVLTPTLPILSFIFALFLTLTYYLILKPEDINELALVSGISFLLGFVILIRPSIAIFISIDHAISPPNKSK